MQSQLPILLAASLLVGVAAGCSTTPQARTAYQTGTQVAPAAEPHQYNVQFRVSKATADGTVVTLAEPKMKVTAGEPAEIKLLDTAETDGLICRARVAEYADRTETSTGLVVMEKGKKVLDHAQVSVAKN